MCLGAAMSFFIGEIVYGHEMPGDGAVMLVQGWKREKKAQASFPAYCIPQIRGGVLRNEGIELFAEYVKRYPSSGGLTDFARSISALQPFL